MSADLQRIIRIVFQGDNQTQRAFGELSSSLNLVESSVRSVTGPMADLADDILKAQAAAITLATGGMALMVQQAGSWSDSFNEISTLLDLTGAALLEFRSNVLTYAATSTASLDDINSALYAAISAGTSYADSLELLSTAERLATAGKAALKDSTVLLASVMNAYGAETSEAARYSDVFFQTVRLGQTTLPELAASLSSVTSIAAAAGIPIETVAAALATLTAKGMPTTEAMTAIRGAISAIISPSGEAAKEAARLGIEFGASALAANGLEGVLLDVYTATGGNVEEMARLFGNVRGLTGVLAAFGQDGGDAFRSTLEEMRDSIGATDEAYARMADNVGQHTQTLINQMRTTLIQGGLPLLDQFGDAAEALGSIFEGLRIGLDRGAFDPLYEAFDDLVSRMVTLGRQVAEALPDALDNVDWTPLLDGLRDLDQALSGIFRALFQDLDPTKAEDLNQIIQTMVNLLGQLGTTSAGVIDQWRPLADLTGRLTQAMGEMDPRVAAVAGQLLGAAHKAEFLWERLGFLNGTLALVGSETTATGDNITWLGITFNALLNPVQAVTQLLQVLFPSLRESATEMTEAATGAEELGGKTGILERALAAMPGPLGVIVNGLGLLGQKAHAATGEAQGLTESLDAIPPDVSVAVEAQGFDDFIRDLRAAGVAVDEIPDEHLIALYTGADIPSLQQAASDIESGIAEIGEPEIVIETLADGTTLIRSGRQIQDGVEQIQKDTPDIEVMAKLDAEVFKASMGVLDTYVSGYFDTIQSGIEWEAKLEIAEVEANAKKVEAIMAATAASAQGAAGVLQSIFGNAADMRDAGFWRSDIERWINEQIDIQHRSLAVQERMADAEIAFMQARMQRMASGDPLITVSGDGLAPHLEAIMFDVLGAVQARAQEDYQAFLLGVT